MKLKRNMPWFNRVLVDLASLGLFGVFLACDSAPQSQQDQTSGKKTSSTTKTDTADDPDAKDGDTSTTVPANRDPAKVAVDSESFFANTIKPLLNDSCSSCHAEPRFNPNPAGPLTIFDFGNMRKLLQDGTDPVNNKFVNKVRNIVTHQGGDICGSDLTADPCKSFLAWGEVEYGVKATLPESGVADRIAAKLTDVTAVGRAIGYAAWSVQPDTMLEVKFYADGDSSSGTALTPVTANRPGYSDGILGGHLFILDLPKSLRDGQSHTLAAYTTVDGKEVELEGSPMTFSSWLPKGAGDYWTANVLPAIAQCSGCHKPNRTYADFNVLIDPSPAKGGSATNNVLYQRAHNGLGHSGANCNAACGTALQTWWQKEFGP